MATKTYYKQNSYIKMPWGKYRGRYLKEVPDDYIKWAVVNWTDVGMAQILADELARRIPEFKITKKNP